MGHIPQSEVRFFATIRISSAFLHCNGAAEKSARIQIAAKNVPLRLILILFFPSYVHVIVNYSHLYGFFQVFCIHPEIRANTI